MVYGRRHGERVMIYLSRQFYTMEGIHLIRPETSDVKRGTGRA